MRQSEARDMRSFLAEPVEEVILENSRAQVDTGIQQGVGVQQGVGARFISPPRDTEDSRAQHDGARFINPSSSDAQSGLNPLRPYRLQRYQLQGVYQSHSTSGALQLRSSGRQGSRQAQARTTADLVPMSQKLVPIEPLPTPQSWERRRRNIYMWLVLFMLFLLVTLGGIGLDSLIASYH